LQKQSPVKNIKRQMAAGGPVMRARQFAILAAFKRITLLF
jgi:hypothetical protein